MKTCPSCSAFWLETSATCRFCGFDPSSASRPAAEAGTGPGRQQAPAPHSPDPRRREGRSGLVVGVVGVVAAVAVAAVGSVTLLGGDDDRRPAAVEPVATTSASTTTAPTPAHPLASVCDGTGQPEAAAYDAARGGAHAVRMVRGSDTWQLHSEDKPPDEAIEEEDGVQRFVPADATQIVPTVDLVICSTTSDRVVTTTECEYTVRGRDTTIEVHHRAAQVVVREARTAQVLAETEVAGEGGCPMTLLISRGERSVDRPPPAHVLGAAAEPFLAGG